MPFAKAFLFCALGIVISVILPILRQALPAPKGGTAGVMAILPRLWEKAKPYVALCIFSLLTSLLLLAFAGDTIKDWRVALLVGYAWDSTLQKLKK